LRLGQPLLLIRQLLLLKSQLACLEFNRELVSKDLHAQVYQALAVHLFGGLTGVEVSLAG
jgi:hypothetical protein